VKPKLIDNFRGQPVFDIELCFSCGLCSKNCPSMAIQMVDVKGKKCPQINLSKCIFCYKCIEDCPRGAIKNSTNFELATTNKSSLIMTPQRDTQMTK
jgi:formate hydrogenlyase subunit 6/NADH:ubiquinone oxidoreductase subunit I